MRQIYDKPSQTNHYKIFTFCSCMNAMFIYLFFTFTHKIVKLRRLNYNKSFILLCNSTWCEEGGTLVIDTPDISIS